MPKFKSAVIEGNKITLDRKELEELRDHYSDVANQYKPKKTNLIIEFHLGFYIGKSDVLTEMLQCFDEQTTE